VIEIQHELKRVQNYACARLLRRIEKAMRDEHAQARAIGFNSWNEQHIYGGLCVIIHQRSEAVK